MATSGQLNTNTTYDSYFWVKWEQLGSQDIANNRTQIKWSCGVYCGHSFYSNAIKMSAVTINGTKVYSGGTYSNYSKGNHTIASGTMWINHNADGKKEFSISSFTGWLYSNYNYSATTTKYTLTTIPRQATITSATDFNDEANPTIQYSNSAGNSVTTLQACISLTGAKDDIAYRDISKTGTSYTFNLTEAEREILRSATTGKSRTVTFFVKTIIGGTTYHSTISKTLSIVNANPIFTADQISYRDANGNVSKITENDQIIVQNLSKLEVVYTKATGQKSATITEYSFAINGIPYYVSGGYVIDFGTISSSQNVTLGITAKDSRGNTTTVKKEITVAAWSKPIFTASLERLNNYEDTTYLTVDASISSVNSKNSMVISYAYKEVGGSYGSSVEIANKTQNIVECDKNKAYVFSITVTDAFGGRTTNEFPLAKGKFPLFIDTQKNAVGINDFPAEDEALRVKDGVGNFIDGIKINGTLIADFPVEIGSSGIWTYKKWNSGEVELWGIATLDAFGDVRHIYKNQALPFAFTNYPVAIMTLYQAEAYTHRQGAIVLSNSYVLGATVIRLSMIRDSGGLESGDTAQVDVYIKGRWK